MGLQVGAVDGLLTLRHGCGRTAAETARTVPRTETPNGTDGRFETPSFTFVTLAEEIEGRVVRAVLQRRTTPTSRCIGSSITGGTYRSC